MGGRRGARRAEARGQASSSPGGRKVKGRSASVISVEAIQRVRASKTGDDGRRVLELLLAEADRALVGRLGGPAQRAASPVARRCAPARSWSPSGRGPWGRPAGR